MGVTEVHYTSDLHFGHELVAGKRGFASAAEHDEVIADLWSEMVRPQDVVIVLGDISAGAHSGALSILGKLPGRKHLIAGNHDRVHPMHRRTFAASMPVFLDVFVSVSPFGRRRLEGTEVLLSHFPYAEWGEGPARGGAAASRHNQFRLPDFGVPLLHGHTHGTEQGHGHELHVGVDAWGFRPVPQEQVIVWLRELREHRAAVGAVERFTWSADMDAVHARALKRR